MDNHPYFSVITCSFNNEKTIGATISSVQFQSFKNYQHIIMDGGSKDCTLKTAQALSDEKTFCYLVPDNGIYEGFNNALKKARGKYIIFLNSDDQFFSTTVLEEVYKATHHANPDIVYGDVNMVKENSECVRAWIAGEFSVKKIKFGWCAPHPGFFFRHEAYNHFFYDDLKISSDYGFMLTCFLKKDVCVIYINKKITNMLIGGVSNSGFISLIEKIKEDRKVLSRVGCGGWLTVILKRLIKIKQFLG